MNNVHKAVAGLCGAVVLWGAWCGCVTYTKYRFENGISEINKKLSRFLEDKNISAEIGKSRHLGFTERSYPVSVAFAGKSYDCDLHVDFGAFSLTGSLIIPEERKEQISEVQKSLMDLSVKYNRIIDDLKVVYEIEPGSSGGFSWSKGKLTFLVDDVSESVPDYARIRFKLGEVSYKDGAKETTIQKIKIMIDSEEAELYAGLISYKDDSESLEIKRPDLSLVYPEADRNNRYTHKSKFSLGRVLLRKPDGELDVDGLKFRSEMSELNGGKDMIERGLSPITALTDKFFMSSFLSPRSGSSEISLINCDSRFAYEIDTEINDSDIEAEFSGWFECPEDNAEPFEKQIFSSLAVNGSGEVDVSLFEIPELKFMKERFAGYAEDPEAKTYKYKIEKKSGEKKILINGKEL